jgi:photosystem II stability/assembly factor-like uncharacterized protein
MKELKCLLLGLAVIFVLVACQQTAPTEVGNPVPPTQNVIGSTATLTQEPTLQPTTTSTPTSQPTATATKAAPTPTTSPVPTTLPTPTVEAGQPITLTSLSMADESIGWAIEAPSHTVRTVDGGLSWTNVTPENLTADYIGSFFLNAQSAWVYDNSDPAKGLAHTTDGGKTWSIITKSLPFTTYASLTFQNEKDGWAETYDVGAGQAYITLYGTHDGGVTWSQIMLGSPDNQVSDLPGVLHLCNICGDSFYYDPARIVIIYGDLASNAVGEVHLSVSMDLGKTWKDLHLPFPSSKFADGLVAPQLPFFYNDKDGYLPFGIVKYNQDGTHAYDILAVYTTHDGGLSWKPNPTVLENVQNTVMHYVLDFVSPMDAFVACGNDLCVTHDGAQTWQKMTSNLNFVYAEGKKYVEWFNFVSPTAGWAITSDDSNQYTVWRTPDGGVTWKEITPRLLP